MYVIKPTRHGGRLTPRQIEFLLLAANGRTNGQIAYTCHVSVDTVKSIFRIAFKRLGVDSRTHAVAIAIKLKIIDLEEIELPGHHDDSHAHHPGQEDPADAHTPIDQAAG